MRCDIAPLLYIAQFPNLATKIGAISIIQKKEKKKQKRFIKRKKNIKR